MRFSLKQTSARSFDLSLPDHEGRTRELGFEHITELGGAIEIVPAAIVLEEAAARLLQLAAADWRMASGRIIAGAPVALVDVFVDGRIPRGDARPLPLDGRASIKRLTGDEIVVEGLVPRLSFGVRVEQLEVEQHEGRGRAALEALAARNLETTVGGFLVSVDEADVNGLEARWRTRGAGPEAETGLEISADSLAVASLSARSRAIEVEIQDLEVTGLAIRGGALSFAKVSVGKIVVRLDVAAPRARETGGDVGAARTEPPAGPRPRVDWRILDWVDGQIDVDVTVDATLPVIRRRKATHYFRVPIEKGVFNYRQVESGLSALENAVIDFDVRGHKLVIERDLPIIRLRKNLVEWRLDPDEMALARQRKVRLRTLPRFEILPSNGKSSDFKLHGLKVGPIDIELSVSPETASTSERPATVDDDAGARAATGPGEAEAGEAQAPADAEATARPVSPGELEGVLTALALRRLSIHGDVSYPEGEGVLAARVRKLAASLRGLRAGGYEIDAGAVRVQAIDPCKITFEGLKPRTVSLTVCGLKLEKVELAPQAAPVAGADAGAAGDGGAGAADPATAVSLAPGEPGDDGSSADRQ